MNIQRIIKAMLLAVLLSHFNVLLAETAPSAIVDSLYALTNQWGVANGLQQYWTSRRTIEKQLLGYEDAQAILKDWRLCMVDFIKENTSVDKSWLREGSSELLRMSYSNLFQTSTNCWFSAADFMGKIETRRTRALKRKQEIEAQSSKEYGFWTNQTRESNLTRNEYLDLDYIIAPVAFSVTNNFPKAILPTLPAEEGATLYTNILRRAGLVQ